MATIHPERRRNRQAGQALYLTAISLVVLVGMLGLGIDMGVLRYEQRLQQTAADAAALAAASDGVYGEFQQAAQAAASANGFPDNGGGQVSNCGSGAAAGTICVQVTDRPTSGPHQGQAGYYEVLVSEVHPTYFMRIFGASASKKTVTARAVATNVGGGSNKPCLLALNVSAGANALVVNGNIRLTACNLVVNGNLQVDGQIDPMQGSLVEVTGTCSGSCPSGVVQGMPAMADPLANLPASPPPPSGCSLLGLLGNLGLNVCNSLSIGPGTTSLSDGVYVVNGVLSVADGAALSASGATFYVPNGTVNLGANGSLTTRVSASAIVAQTINVSANVTLNLGGSGNSAIKSAVLVE